MIRLLDVGSDSDYGASVFDEEFKVEDVVQGMEPGDVKTLTIKAEKDIGYPDMEIYVELFEFGEVDDKFIEYIKDRIQDYDDSKHHNFYILREIN